MSTPKAKKVRVLKGYGRMPDEPFLTTVSAATDGMDGNPDVPSPPVPAATLKAEAIKLGQLMGANDGGKKAVAAKNKQREVVNKMMEQDAHYVEQIANNDPAIIAKAGFQIMSGKTPSKPLDKPVIQKIVAGLAGQFLFYVKPMSGVRMFQLEYGITGPGGALPTAWTELPFAKARPATPVNGLTPGTSYTFKVKGFGTLGFSDYSDPIVKIAT